MQSPENSNLVVYLLQKTAYMSISLSAKLSNGGLNINNRTQDKSGNKTSLSCVLLFVDSYSIFKFTSYIQSYFLGNVKNLLSLFFLTFQR